MAAITAELALEISKFQGALKQAQSQLSAFKGRTERTGGGLGTSLTSSISSAVTSIGPIFKAGIVAAAAGATAAIAAMGAGLKSAFDLGGRLSDVSARMGTTAGRAQVLETALANAGMAGESAATVVQKLQDQIATAVQSGNNAKFEALGLDPSELIGMDSISAFEQVGEAIAAIENPMQRTQAAMEIWGRKGAELLVLFGDKGAMAFAKEQLGDQADILDQSAADFDRASDILGGAFKKLQGFFVGLGSRLVDHLMPVFDAFNKLDLAGIGQRFGDAIVSAVQWVKAAWETIDFAMAGQLARDSLTLGFKSAVNLLYQSLVASFFAAVQMLVEQIKNVITLFSILTTTNFWRGLGNVLLGLARSFGAILLEFIAQAIENLKRIPGVASLLGDADAFFRDVAEEARGMAGDDFAASGDALTPVFDQVSQRITEMFGNVADAFTDNFANAATIFDTQEEQDRLQDVGRQIAERARLNAENQPPKAVQSAAGSPTATPPVGSGGDSARVAPGLFASAVNLIMGRSANELILDESKKQTTKLESIDRKLGELNRNLERPAPQRAVVAAPVMPFDNVARFA